MSATRAVSTESSLIPRTILNLAFWINVQKRAFLFVACIEPRVEITFRHFRHVIFMKKLAAVAFLTECSKPVLAYDRFLFGFDVTKGAELLIAMA